MVMMYTTTNLICALITMYLKVNFALTSGKSYSAAVMVCRPFTKKTPGWIHPYLTGAPVVDLPILVLYDNCQSRSTVLGSEH